MTRVPPLVSPALAPLWGKESLLLFARFLASVCKLLVQSRPILYSVAQNTKWLFFPLHNPKDRAVGGHQGVVGRGWNKTHGLLTTQRLFQFVQAPTYRPMSPVSVSPVPVHSQVGLQRERGSLTFQDNTASTALE